MGGPGLGAGGQFGVGALDLGAILGEVGLNQFGLQQPALEAP